MQLISNSVLAFAILSSGLLSTILAAPTPQIFPLGGEDGQASVQSRQCYNSKCTGKSDDQSASISRQTRSSNKISQGSQATDNMLIADARGSNTQSRQIHGGQMESESDIESRQLMHAMGSEEGDTQSRQVHGGQMAGEGDIEGRQLMHAMGTEEGDTQSRQVHGGLMAEDGQDVESRQVMHASSDDSEAFAMESRQSGAFGQGTENGDVRTRQVMHSSSADQGIVSRPVGPNKEKMDVSIRQST